MEWHIDDVIYEPSQIEVVYTIDNNSDCNTMWREENIHSIQSTPNSALILRAGGVEHKVSPLTVGKRTILKMAWVRENAVLDDTMKQHASHHNKKVKTKKNTQKSRKQLNNAKRRK